MMLGETEDESELSTTVEHQRQTRWIIGDQELHKELHVCKLRNDELQTQLHELSVTYNEQSAKIHKMLQELFEFLSLNNTPTDTGIARKRLAVDELYAIINKLKEAFVRKEEERRASAEHSSVGPSTKLIRDGRSWAISSFSTW